MSDSFDFSSSWQKQANERLKAYGRFIDRADRRKVLQQLPDAHEKASEMVHCLQCAACCKNYSPRFKTPDIKRIARHLKLKESQFIEKYLRLDEEGDYVLQSKPCPFLGSDNFCSIYEVRPSDCARFPYTDEDVLLKRKQLTLKNVSFCPIVFVVMEALMKGDQI